MFDLTSTKLLLLGLVALLVIGPKDFPVLLRTIGKYVAIIRGHAKEFRAQFDEAMRETELVQVKSDIGQLKTDLEKMGRDTEASLNATQQSVEQTLAETRHSVEASLHTPAAVPATQVAQAADPMIPATTTASAPPAAHTLAEPETGLPQHPPAPAQTGSAPAVERSGV